VIPTPKHIPRSSACAGFVGRLGLSALPPHRIPSCLTPSGPDAPPPVPLGRRRARWGGPRGRAWRPGSRGWRGTAAAGTRGRPGARRARGTPAAPIPVEGGDYQDRTRRAPTWTIASSSFGPASGGFALGITGPGASPTELIGLIPIELVPMARGSGWALDAVGCATQMGVDPNVAPW